MKDGHLANRYWMLCNTSVSITPQYCPLYLNVWCVRVFTCPVWLIFSKHCEICCDVFFHYIVKHTRSLFMSQTEIIVVCWEWLLWARSLNIYQIWEILNLISHFGSDTHCYPTDIFLNKLSVSCCIYCKFSWVLLPYYASAPTPTSTLCL